MSLRWSEEKEEQRPLTHTPRIATERPAVGDASAGRTVLITCVSTEGKPAAKAGLMVPSLRTASAGRPSIFKEKETDSISL
jgi:hypothetical protein